MQKHSHPTEYFEVLEPGSVELMNLRNMERWILRPVKIEMIVRVRTEHIAYEYNYYFVTNLYRHEPTKNFALS